MKRQFSFGIVEMHVLEDEGVDVGPLVDTLRHGFSGAMTGVAVDSDELRLEAGIGLLERCGILERMGGNDAVVVVGGGHKDSGIDRRVVMDIVERRIAEQVFGHLGAVVAAAVVGRPVPADSEEMVAHHVHDADARYCHSEEVGTQVDAGTDEDSGDKITIALQENRINELERQLSEREQELSGLKTENSELKSTVDYAAVTAKAVKIFPELSNIRCGSVTDSSGEHALLLADSAKPQDAAAQKLLENWLAAETGSSRAEVRVNVLEPEPATDETGTAEDGIPVE